MDREMRLRAFMEDYTRLVQLLDNVITINETLKNIELIVAILVIEVIGLTFLAVLTIFCRKCCCVDNQSSYDITTGPSFKTNESRLPSVANGTYKTSVKSTLLDNNNFGVGSGLSKRESFGGAGNREKGSLHSIGSPLVPSQTIPTFFKPTTSTSITTPPQQSITTDSPKRSSIDILNNYSSSKL
uniref:Uncharacterized protein n=1 Tax=Parastrongyloides trichosuri TaxID=131310 RepID=A0A0N4ZC10_PARTI